jgi:dihydroorotase-like cyclic amidohydrolase
MGLYETISKPAGSSSSITQLSLRQTLSRNTPFAKESVKAKAITNAIRGQNIFYLGGGAKLKKSLP